MGTLDPAKTFFRLPWIWGWIQQKRFFGSPGFGGGSSKKLCKSLQKMSQHPFLGSPSAAQISSAPLFGHPFSCLNFLSIPFSVSLSYVYSNSMIKFRFQVSLLSTLNTLRSSPSATFCLGSNTQHKKLDRRESCSPRWHRGDKIKCILYSKTIARLTRAPVGFGPKRWKMDVGRMGNNGGLFELLCSTEQTHIWL